MIFLFIWLALCFRLFIWSRLPSFVLTNKGPVSKKSAPTPHVTQTSLITTSKAKAQYVFLSMRCTSHLFNTYFASFFHSNLVFFPFFLCKIRLLSLVLWSEVFRNPNCLLITWLHFHWEENDVVQVFTGLLFCKCCGNFFKCHLRENRRFTKFLQDIELNKCRRHCLEACLSL